MIFYFMFRNFNVVVFYNGEFMVMFYGLLLVDVA